ncbi:MAG: C-terminal helicase domain-containing protein, partial [Gammaproteobacteria bacterium]|nr:C-terminal helicase domain-containing protein [Gammaproteobacteria bacterium]
MSITRHLLKKPVRIDLSSEKIAAPQIRQELYKTNNPQHKARLLKHFLNDANIYKAIIFSATKINADKLANQLRDEGFAAAALHGDLRQNVRNRTIDQLRRGKIQILVATDVAARGIDISDITHVINYDLPRFCEDYVHRIGRTGRAGKSGIAISFVLPTDMRHVQRIERYIGQRLKLTTLAADGSESVTPIKAANEAKNDREVSKYHRDYSEKSFSRKNKKTSSARDWDERTRSRDDRVRDRSDSTRSRDERVRYRSDSTRSRDDRVRDRSDSTRSREDRVRDRDDRRFKNDRREDSHSKSDKNEKPFRKKKFFSNQKKSLKSSKNRDFKEANSA